MQIKKFITKFALNNNKGFVVMLGFSSSREPVRGEVAREIREQLQRIATKSLNEHDRKISMMQKNLYL